MRRFLSVIVIGILLLLLAGCGGDQEDKSRTVKIIVAMADFQTSQGASNGIQIALDEVKNQVGNTHVEVVYLRTSTDTENYSIDQEVAAATQAANDKNVVAYIGLNTSGQAKAAIPILNKAGIASLSISATWPGLTKTGFGTGEPGIYYPTGRRTFFRVVASDEVQGVAGAYWAKQLGYQNVCLLDDGQVYGVGVVGIFDVTATDLGLQIVCQEEYDPGVRSVEGYTEVAARVVAANPDVVYLGALVHEGGAEMIAALRQQKPGLPIIGPDGIVNYDPIIQEYGALVNDIYATDILVPPNQLGTEVAAKFIAAYQEKYSALPNTWAGVGYEAMKVVLYGIEKAESPSRVNVLDALYNFDEYSGAFGTWSFDDNGDTSMPAISIWQIQNGKWTFVERASMKM